MQSEPVVVLITAGSREEAERVASALLEARLAACVNLLPGVTSLFWWEGKIDRAEEVLLLVKTRRGLMPALVTRVRAVHSYDVFEAVALPIVAGSPEYLQWVDEATSAIDLSEDEPDGALPVSSRDLPLAMGLLELCAGGLPAGGAVPDGPRRGQLHDSHPAQRTAGAGRPMVLPADG